MTDDLMTVDDLVTGKAAERLGEGRLAVGAVLLVETIGGEENTGFRYVVSEGLNPRLAIGMMRSALQRMEAEEAASWEDEDD